MPLAKRRLTVAALVLAAGCGRAASSPPPAAAVGFPSGPLVDLSHTYDGTTIFWPTADAFDLLP